MARAITEELTVAQVYDKYSNYASNGLTPWKLASIFRAADAGDVMAQMELFEEIEEKDPHLFSQLQTRKNAVVGLDFEIMAAGDSAFDKTIADFVENTINSIEGIEDIFFDLLDAIGKGIAISEIIWKYEDGYAVISDIKSRHQRRLFWDHEDVLKISTLLEPAGMNILENKFIIHKYKARSGHPARAGVLRVVAWMYLFKNYDVKDWVSFCELYGMPLRLGKYNPGASEEEKQALMKALVQLGSDAAGIIPEGTEIEFKESQKTTSINVYESLARYCDEQISKAVLGQTLTSDSAGSGGSYAQSKTHNEVRHDLTVADCKALASTLKRDMIKPLVLLNFGDGVPIPSIQFDCKEPADLQLESGVLDILVNKVGLKIPASYAYEKFGIPIPEATDEILKPEVRLPPMLPTQEQREGELTAHKATRVTTNQDEIDKLVEKSIEKSTPVFKKLFEPINFLLKDASSLEELLEKFQDEVFIGKLMEEMDVGDFEELLQRAMMIADLKGRVGEHEEQF